jgi:hypothetical protein
MEALSMATYTIRELSALVGANPGTIRSWVRLGLLPAVTFRGARTVYGDDHMRRIEAIKRLRGDFWPQAQILCWMKSATTEDIERLLHPVDPTAPRTPPEPTYPSERWERVVLLPGLELLVRDEPALRRLAQQIFTYFGSAQTPDRAVSVTSSLVAPRG